MYPRVLSGFKLLVRPGVDLLETYVLDENVNIPMESEYLKAISIIRTCQSERSNFNERLDPALDLLLLLKY